MYARTLVREKVFQIWVQFRGETKKLGSFFEQINTSIR